jgi:hypothetical protein
MPRRAPRSRHRSAKLSARRLLTPSGGPGRSGRCSIRCPSCLWTWRHRSASRESGVSGSLIRGAFGVVDRCLAPPRRCATRAPRREEDGGGRPPRAQQAFHASAGIVKGGESFAENSDPWVASDRERQQSYPVSRPLAHRLHSSYQAAFEAALPHRRQAEVGRRSSWGMPSAARHTARSPGRATSGASAIASAHGSRCRAAGSAADACTSSTRSRTRRARSVR